MAVTRHSYASSVCTGPSGGRAGSIANIPERRTAPNGTTNIPMRASTSFVTCQPHGGLATIDEARGVAITLSPKAPAMSA